MNLSSISIHSLSEALAWTIFHSIWQAALIAGLLALAFRFINQNNARLRYTLASLSMLLIFVLAGFTFVLSLPAQSLPVSLGHSGINTAVIAETSSQAFSWDWLKSLLPTQILFPILLKTWIIGICLLSLRMVINYTTALRLKKHKAFPLDEKHLAIAHNVLKRFKIKKAVLFKESRSIDSPSLIGYFKPVILLPISLMSGIPDNQLETIIAHELAHISRHDYLVQFIQGIIEILFFYHPMVWWLSSVVNTEREHICDDLAVKVCGESLTLIKALNNMESLRKKKPEFVLSFSGKKANLLHRVRRILNPVSVKHPKLERGLISALFVFALSGMILFSNLANSKNQVQDESKNSANLLIGDEMSSISPLIHAPQKKKKKSKKKKIAAPAEPAVASVDELQALPEVPELNDKAIALPDTVKEVEEVLEIQKDALKDALEELEEVSVEINEETIKELKESLKELESVDIDIEKELIEAEAEMDIELKELEMIEIDDSFKDIDENTDLSEKEKKELKAKIKASLEKVNSEEFRQQIRENLERGRESLKHQMEKIKSGQFQKNIEIQKEKIKEMIEKFESPEFQKNLKENLEKSREHIKARLKEIESPEFQEELKEKIKESKKKNKKTKIKFSSDETPLCLLNGLEISKKVMEKLDPDSIDSITVLKDEESKKAYGSKARDGIILIRTKNTSRNNATKNKTIKFKGKTKNPPLYIIDGSKMDKSMNINDIDPADIESITVLKDESAIEKYGKEAKNGVIEIITKNERIKNFNEYMKSK